MLFRIETAGVKIPALSSKRIEPYCQLILENLWDRNKAKDIFKNLENMINLKLSESKLLKREAHVLRAFTEELKPSLKNNKLNGILTYYNENRGFGFIRIENFEEDIFVHVSEIKISLSADLNIGDKIRFDIEETYKGKQARNLELGN